MEHIERAEAVKRLSNALKKATGRTWRVYGKTGTSWGYIRISCPKSRSIDQRGEMGEEDRAILGRIFNNGLQMAHPQGYSVTPESREWAVAKAEAAAQ